MRSIGKVHLKILSEVEVILDFRTESKLSKKKRNKKKEKKEKNKKVFLHSMLKSRLLQQGSYRQVPWFYPRQRRRT